MTRGQTDMSVLLAFIFTLRKKAKPTGFRTPALHQMARAEGGREAAAEDKGLDNAVSAPAKGDASSTRS